MKWREEEVKLLKKLYPLEDMKILVKLFKRKPHTISTKASRLNIKRIIIPNVAEKNGMWRGSKASLNAIHTWIKARKKKPKYCQKCHKKLVYDLANISGKYKRDIKDYEWLCRSCHMKKDGRLKKLQGRIKNG